MAGVFEREKPLSPDWRFLSPERRHSMTNGEGRELAPQTMAAILSMWFADMGLLLMGRWL
jgi:hypothetical protein